MRITSDDAALKNRLLAALARKAEGGESSETVDEYGIKDGEPILLKRKVTTKHTAPDLSAIEYLLSLMGEDGDAMSESELAREKIRLLRLLREVDGGA